MPSDENERYKSQEADAQRHEHQVSQAEQVLWKPFAVRPPPKHGHYAAEACKGGADAGEAEEDVQDMLVHGCLEIRELPSADSARFLRGVRARYRRSPKFGSAPTSGLQRRTLPAMETFLAPRKSFVAIGVACALAAARLWRGRTPSAAPAGGADRPTPPRAKH